MSTDAEPAQASIGPEIKVGVASFETNGEFERKNNLGIDKNQRKIQWLAIISLIFSAVSAISAVGAVYIGTKQVEAALEVVTKTEQTKYVSEFAVAADQLCGELIPPLMRPSVLYESKNNRTGSVARPVYLLSRSANLEASEVIGSWKNNLPKLSEAITNTSSKARMLVVWSQGQDIDYDIYTFSLQLAGRSIDEARKASTTMQSSFLKGREICESHVDEALLRYRR